MRSFIYVSQVRIDELTGQSVFEKELIKAILDRGEQLFPDTSFKIFTVGAPNSLQDPRVKSLPIFKKSSLGRIRYQWNLFVELLRYLRAQKGNEVFVFVRYLPNMVSPLVLSWFFPFRLTIRTGPILPNLYIYNKNPNFLVYHGIRLILGGFCARASTIITVTEKISEWVRSTYSVPISKCAIVPNGANTKIFSPMPADRGRFGLPKDRLVFGYVGSLYQDQGVHIAIEAFGKMKRDEQKRPHFFIVGGGTDLERLKKLTADLGLQNEVTFSGPLPHSEVPSAINACDFMLAPFTKRAFATTGSSALKLYEYLACNKPVLASQGDDHLFIERENLGRLVEPENIDEWALAMERLSSESNPQFANGSEYVRRNHSYETVAEKILGLSLQAKPIG